MGGVRERGNMDGPLRYRRHAAGGQVGAVMPASCQRHASAGAARRTVVSGRRDGRQRMDGSNARSRVAAAWCGRRNHVGVSWPA
jgi:hypothetical protein